MTQYSSKFLGLPGPSVAVVVSTVLFLALVAVPPIVALSRHRRRSAGGDQTGAVPGA